MTSQACHRYVSRCVYGHLNLWNAGTRPLVDTMAWCPGCAAYRRVFEVVKERDLPAEDRLTNS